MKCIYYLPPASLRALQGYQPEKERPLTTEECSLEHLVTEKPVCFHPARSRALGRSVQECIIIMNSEETRLSLILQGRCILPPFTVSHRNQFPYNVTSCLQILMVTGSTNPTLPPSMQLRKTCSVFRT